MFWLMMFSYPGIASQATFFLNGTEPVWPRQIANFNSLSWVSRQSSWLHQQFGSLYQIGWAYAIGIAFAIIVCAPTSGGHFNPAITLCFAIWQGFPWKKVPYYIFAQILGSFFAGLLLVGQYHPQLSMLAAGMTAKGLDPNSLGGPGSVLCSFPALTETNYGYLFFIEFFVDSFIVSLPEHC
jgi:glycerol uptake facilitator-like aquaporin